MDFEYEGANDFGGNILWGRIAVFGAALLIFLLLGRCTAGGGVDQSELDTVASELATAQTQLTQRDQAIATLQARVSELEAQVANAGGGGTTGTPNPTGTTAPAPAGAPTPGTQTYVVQAGDTLSGIAEAVYGDPLAFGVIASANGISESNPLRVGQELVIPPNPDSQGTAPT